MCVVSIAEYAETDEMRIGLLRYDKIRNETLDLLWGSDYSPAVPGIIDFKDASADTKAFIYDEVRKVVERFV